MTHGANHSYKKGLYKKKILCNLPNYISNHLYHIISVITEQGYKKSWTTYKCTKPKKETSRNEFLLQIDIFKEEKYKKTSLKFIITTKTCINCSIARGIISWIDTKQKHCLKGENIHAHHSQKFHKWQISKEIENVFNMILKSI